MANYFKKWKKKKLFDKITDILFVLLIISFLIPGPRKSILTFVNRVKAMVIQPDSKKHNYGTLNTADFQNWFLKDLNGQTHSFAEFQGKVIYINFWATWCGPCLGEMPEIQKLYDKYKDNDKISFILATSDHKSTVQQFLDKHKEYTFPIYIMQNSAPSIIETQTLPTSYLIDKKGNIVLLHKGAANWSGDKMEKIVNSLL